MNIASNPDSFIVRSRVFACLEAGYLHVIIGYGLNHIDGGFLDKIEVKYFPINCRMPNTFIDITFTKQLQVLKIELAK